MDFVVRTRGGRLVRDLKKEDVVLLEDGVRQEIQALIPPGGFTAERSDIVRKTGDVHAANPRLVVLAFDSMGAEARKRAADAAAELVRQVPEGSMFFAVAGLQPRLNWWLDFTSAPQAVIAAIRRAAGAAGLAYGVEADQPGKQLAFFGAHGREETAWKAADARLATLNRRAEEFDRQLQGTRQLGSLLALTGALRNVPGRKSVVFFSDGLRRFELDHLFRAVTGMANRASVTIYALDASGLRIVPPSAETLAALRGRDGHAGIVTSAPDGGEPPDPEKVATANAEEGLRLLAEETGGFLISGTNRLETRLAGLLEDFDGYWTATYRPANRLWDGEWRRLELRVRRRGLRVHSRAGYWAVPAGEDDVLLPEEMRFLRASVETSSSAELECSANAFDLPSPGGSSVLVSYEVPIQRLQFVPARPAGQQYAAAIFLTQIRDSEGRTVRRLYRSIPVQGAEEQIRRLPPGRILYHDFVVLPTGRYHVLLGAMDAASRRMAVRRVELETASAAGGLVLGAPVLFTRTAPCRDEADPLCFGRQAAVPELGQVAKDESRILIRYQLAPLSAEPLRLNVSWWREDRLVAAAAPPDLEWDQNRPGWVILRLPQQATAPGRYQLRVLAKQGEMQTERTTVVEIR